MACNCPLPAAITQIDANSCPEELGQIQRVWFVRKSGDVMYDLVTNTNNTPTPSLSGIDPDNSAGWTALRALSDDSKLITPPLFGGSTSITPSEPVFQGGGDNTTLNGQQYYVNTPDSTFSGRFDQLTKDQTAQLKALRCEDLEVFFINEDGDIIGKKDGDEWTGFPLSGVPVLGSRDVQGFGVRDSNTLIFQLTEDWDEYIHKITPSNFNALTF